MCRIPAPLWHRLDRRMRPSRFQRQQILGRCFRLFHVLRKILQIVSENDPSFPTLRDGWTYRFRFLHQLCHPVPVGAGPKCRLCRSSFRRHSPGQKYCDRCRRRREGRRDARGLHQDATDALTILRETMYRVHTPSLTILNLDGERIPVTIPANSCIQIDVLPPVTHDCC